MGWARADAGERGGIWGGGGGEEVGSTLSLEGIRSSVRESSQPDQVCSECLKTLGWSQDPAGIDHGVRIQQGFR